MKYKTVVRKIADLIPYENNSRLHSEEQIDQIVESIKEFGFTNPPIIDENNNILAGHGRIQAATILEYIKIDCVQTKGLSDTQKKAYIIADNQLPQNAEWDIDKLTDEINSLSEMDFDIGKLGFSDDFILSLGSVDFDEASEEEQGHLDTISEKLVTCPNCKNVFDSRGNEC